MADKKKGHNPISQLGWIAGQATKQYLLDDYSSNITQLVSDAKIVGETLTEGKTRITDVIVDIKENGAKKIHNWFYDRGDALGEFDLDDNDSDFDAGFDEEMDEEDEEQPSKILDESSMKDIVRGQLSAQYKMAGKQAEASMINAAEITSAVNARTAEIITSINNVNSSLIAISEKLDVVIYSQKGNVESSSISDSKQDGVFNADGRITLGSYFNSMKNGASNAAGTLSMFLQGGFGPADLLSMVLDETGLKTKKLNHFTSKLGLDVHNEKLAKVLEHSYDEIASDINNTVGNIIHDTLVGSTSVTKTIGDKLNIPSFITNIVDNMVGTAVGTRMTAKEDFRSKIDQTYHTENAKFDGMVRQTIVEVIPEYLRLITGALTNKNYQINMNGHLTTDEVDVMEDVGKHVGGNMLSRGLSESLFHSMSSQQVFHDMKNDDFTEGMEVFTRAVVYYMYEKGIKHLTASSMNMEFINGVASIFARQAVNAGLDPRKWTSRKCKLFTMEIFQALFDKKKTNRGVFGYNNELSQFPSKVDAQVAALMRDLEENANRAIAVGRGSQLTALSEDTMFKHMKQSKEYREKSSSLYDTREQVRSEIAESDMIKNIPTKQIRNAAIEKRLKELEEKQGGDWSKLSEGGWGELERELEKMITKNTDRINHQITTSVIHPSDRTGNTVTKQFQSDLFSRLDTIIRLLKIGGDHTPVRTQSPNIIIPPIHGSGDHDVDHVETKIGATVNDDTLSDADKIQADMVRSSIQMVGNDGSLTEDSSILKRLTTLIKNTKVKQNLTNTITQLTTGLKQNKNTTDDTGQKKGGIFGILSSGVSKAVGMLKTASVTIIKGIASPFIKYVAKPVGNFLLNMFKSGWEDVKTGISEVWTNFKNKRTEKATDDRGTKKGWFGRFRRNEVTEDTETTDAMEPVSSSVERTVPQVSQAENHISSQKQGTSTSTSDASVSKTVGVTTATPIISTPSNTTSTSSQPETTTTVVESDSGIGTNQTKTQTPSVNTAPSSSTPSSTDSPEITSSADGKKKGGIKGFLSKITSGLGGIGKILMGFGKMFASIIMGFTAVQTFMNLIQKTLKAGLDPLKKGLGKITKILTPLVKTVGKVLSSIAGLISSIVESLSGVLDTLVNTVGSLLEGVLTAVEPLFTVISSVVGVLSNALVPIVKVINDILTPILQVISTSVGVVSNLLTAFSPAFESIFGLLEPLLKLLDPFIALINDTILSVLTPYISYVEKIMMPAVEMISGCVQLLASSIIDYFAHIEKFAGNVLLGIGAIVEKLTGDDKMKEAGESLIANAEETNATAAAMKRQGTESLKSGANTLVNNVKDAINGTSSDEKTDSTSSSSSASSTIASIPPPTGGSVDTLGSGDSDTDPSGVDMIAQTVLSIGSVLQEILKPVSEFKSDLIEAAQYTTTPIGTVMGNLTNEYTKVSKQLTLPSASATINVIAPKIKSIDATNKQMLGALQSIGGQVIGAMGLQLAASGQPDAANALFQTSAGLAMVGLTTTAEGVTANANLISRQFTGQNFNLSSLYTSDEIAASDQPYGSTSNSYHNTSGDNIDTSDSSSSIDKPINTPDSPSSTVTIIPKPSSSENYRDYYGSGNSQGSYGTYLNMCERGCGPIALADALHRRQGSSVNAGSLAKGMASSGNYSTSRGTSVGGFLNTASSMGMGYTVGGVTPQSLKRATPNNPITLVGSGGGFGTRNGNTHYVNVIGTDNVGGAYVSNPLTGRVERRTTNDMVSGSLVGLYGSGDVPYIPHHLFELYGTGSSNGKQDWTDAEMHKWWRLMDSATQMHLLAIYNKTWGHAGGWESDAIRAQTMRSIMNTNHLSNYDALSEYIEKTYAETFNQPSYTYTDSYGNSHKKLNLTYTENNSSGTTTSSVSPSRTELEIVAEWITRIKSNNSSRYATLYDDMVKAWNLEVQNGATNPTSGLKGWLRSKLKLVGVDIKNASVIPYSKIQSIVNAIIGSGGTSSTTTGFEDTSSNTDSSTLFGTSSANTATTNGIGQMTNVPGGTSGYISTEMKHTAPSASSINASATGSGGSFAERFKEAMSGLTSAISSVFNFFSSDSDAYSSALEEDSQSELESQARETLGNEAYEAYEAYAYQLYANDYPQQNGEDGEDYRKRLQDGWTEKKKQAYMLQATKVDVATVNAMKYNSQIDAMNGVSSTIYGEYDNASGTWTGGLWNALNQNGGNSNVSSYQDPYGGKFVSDGGAIMWTDKYTPTILNTDITEDGGVAMSKSPIHEFFAKTAGMNENKLANYAFSKNNNWYTMRNNPDTSGVGSTGDNHKGIDILTSPKSHMMNGNAELHAITGGKIVDSRGGAIGDSWDANGGWGNTIAWIDAAGYKHRYAHMLENPMYEEGDTINGGEILGWIGSTGNSTGEHLHYQIEDPSGNAVNPLTYFKYHEPSVTSANGKLGKIEINEYLQKGANAFNSYKNKNYTAFFKSAQEAGFTPEQMAQIIGMQVWEDSVRKITGEKSLTKVVSDSGGQLAYGLMNWIPTSGARVGEDCYEKGSTLTDQLAWMKDAYYNGKSSSSQWAHIHDNIWTQSKSTAAKVMGHEYNLNPNDYWGDYASQDLIESSIHYMTNAIQPSGAACYSNADYHGKYAGAAAAAWNWMLESGYATSAASPNQSSYAVTSAEDNNGQGGVGDYTDAEENKQIIWSYLTNQLGFSKQGAAGAMGNMEAESGFYPYALFGHTVDDYALDYAKKVDETGKFPTNDPYGIVQWLSDRRSNLLAHAKSSNVSISDLPMQLSYLENELNTGYTKVRDNQKTVADVQEASDFWQQKFEVCGDATARRRESSQKIYEQFKDWSGSVGGYTDANSPATLNNGSSYTVQLSKSQTSLNWPASQYGLSGLQGRSGGFANAAFGFLGGIKNYIVPTVTTNGGANNGNLNASTWINTLNKTIQAADQAGLHSYNMGGNTTITVDGQTIHGRPDCTGMIQFPLDYLGYDINNVQSSALVSDASMNVHPIKKDGKPTEDFTAYKWGTEVTKDTVQPGDILVRNGHGEIGYGMINDRLHGWNYGSTDSILQTQSVANAMLGGTAMETAMQDSPTLSGNGGNSTYAYVIRPTSASLASSITSANAVSSEVSGYSNSGLAKNMNSKVADLRHRRNQPITKITWHTWAGSSDDLSSLENTFVDRRNKGETVSVNYGISNTGEIGRWVDEGYGAWTTSSKSNDASAVTLEIANTPGAKSKGDEWPISDAAMQSAINLSADIARRNNISQYTFTATGDGYDGDGADGSWTYHRMFKNKACPGNYIFNRTNSIISEVNKRISGSGDIAIPPIDDSVISEINTPDTYRSIWEDQDFVNATPTMQTTNHITITKPDHNEAEMMEQLMRNTYNVRAQQVEVLLEKILEKMDTFQTSTNVKTHDEITPFGIGNGSLFPNNQIPTQIQRLAKG